VPKLVPYTLPSSVTALTQCQLNSVTSTQCRSATINAVIKCMVVSVHSCSLYRSSAQLVHTFETISEYALKPIRHNCTDVGTSIIKRIARCMWVRECVTVLGLAGGSTVRCWVRSGPMGSDLVRWG